MSNQINYIINGVSTYGLGSTTVQVAEAGLSLTTTTDNFSMNGLGFLYNGLGATWNDVRQKVQDLKAVVAPPDITTLTVNNRIQITNGTNTSTITPTSMTATTFTGALVGNASTSTTSTNATNVYNSGITTAGAYGVAYMTNAVGNTTISSDTVGNHLTFNPSTNTLATRNLTLSGGATALSAPNATAISAPNANITATTFTGALTGNATSSNIATTAYNLNALNPITPQYLYPVANPSLIGWSQVITTTGWTFNSITKAYACNTTPLVAGIYIMRAYVYCGNSSFYTGQQLINMVASNSFINNNSTSGFIDPSNASPMGYLFSRIPYNTGDAVHNATFVVNNTGAGFYPYWAIAVNNTTQISPAGNGVPQMNFCRIA